MITGDEKNGKLYDPYSREYFESQYNQVWNTEELRRDFFVHGFLAPFVVVTRKADNKKGSMQFTHMPRYYYNFVED